ncbi:MAG: hypothetical protein PT119_18555 [Aphanizomenon gracile PMC627.10]|nr:hypothetical protein [Aphanizomenon gracile PMC627.10]
MQQRFAIALPTSQQRSHTTPFLNELLAAALRYRTPNIPKQRTACSSASLSHTTTPILNNRTPHPQTAIAHNPNFKRSQFQLIPKQRSLTTLILNDRPPHIPKQRSLTTTLILSDRIPTYS